MKQLYQLAKMYPPARGGIESVTYMIHTACIRAGIRSFVFCFDSNKTSDKTCADNIFKFNPLFKLSSQPFSFRYILKSVFSVPRDALVLLHYPNILAAFAVVISPFNRNLIVFWHSDVVNKGVLGFLSKPFEYLMLRKAKLVLATSPNYVDGSKSLAKFSSKISILPLGVDHNIVDFDSLHHKFNFHGKKVILSVGRLVDYKGFDLLVEASQFLDANSVVVIVGAGPLQESLLQLITSLNLIDKVFILNNISNADLEYLYSIASLFCLPSINKAEAFGVVLIEAMAHKLPLVTYKIPGSGVSWVNKDQCTGIVVDYPIPELFSNAINTILRDDDLKSIYAANSYRRYKEHFTSSIFCKKLIDYLNFS